MHLSKSDFKTARECPAKLYYKKLRYPSTLADNDYLRYLAEGGFMVEKAAQLLCPEGREFAFPLGRTREAADATRVFLEGPEDGVRFEAVVTWGNLMARIDILEKRGRTLNLVEVKSISVDTSDDNNPLRGKRGGIESRMRPYLEDVAFQTLLLRQAFPEFTVAPFLCVVDKALKVGPEATLDRFVLHAGGGERFSRPDVEYRGDVEALRANPPIVRLNVSGEVDELAEEVWTEATCFAESVQGDQPIRLDAEIGPDCAKCEYRFHPASRLGEPGIRDGFHECWGGRALADPHILDLYYARNYGGATSGMIQRLAAEGRVNLVEMDPDLCQGARGERQAIQIRHSRSNTEYLDPALTRLLRDHEYPLHFIDFETTRTALPHHPGMHPYELITFQWSCHTLREPGSAPEHTEWICTDLRFPNFDFARSLRDCIGDDGTVYIWSHHEKTCMREIAEQMSAHGEHDPYLAAWLLRFEESCDKRVIDLCKLAGRHYFHPEMKGSLSIKYVLPAVWRHSPDLWEDPTFRDYHRLGVDGLPMNPYHTLPALELSDGSNIEAIKEGTGAIRAYEDILFGLASRDPERKHAIRDLLLQYCKLDTAAMVMIWRRWVNPSTQARKI